MLRVRYCAIAELVWCSQTWDERLPLPASFQSSGVRPHHRRTHPSGPPQKSGATQVDGVVSHAHADCSSVALDRAQRQSRPRLSEAIEVASHVLASPLSGGIKVGRDDPIVTSQVSAASRFPLCRSVHWIAEMLRSHHTGLPKEPPDLRKPGRRAGSFTARGQARDCQRLGSRLP
jgi:hypothetical protein